LGEGEVAMGDADAFRLRIDLWTDDGDNIVEHVAVRSKRVAELRPVLAQRCGTEPWRLYQLVSPEERAMKKGDHQKGHSRRNTANIGGAAYAPQQDEPHSKGDARTPNKPIGEVAYANRDPTKKKTGKS